MTKPTNNKDPPNPFKYIPTMLLIYLYLLYSYGFIYGIIACVLFSYLSDHLLNTYFKMRFCLGSDFPLIFDDDEQIMVNTAFQIIDKATVDEIKQSLAKRMFTEFFRFRCTIVSILGVYFWKEIDDGSNMYEEQVYPCPDQVHDEQGIADFCGKLMRSRVDKNGLQWELYVQEDYLPDKSVVFFRVNHAVCDGMAFITLFAYIQDQIDQSVIPPMGRGNLIQTIISHLLTPFYFPYFMIKDLSLKKSQHPSPFNVQSYSQLSTEKQLAITKEIDFDTGLRSVYKNIGFKCTFNDFIVGACLYCIKTINDKADGGKYSKLEKILGNIPVSMRPFPKSKQEVSIRNNVSGINMEFPLKPDLIESIKAVREAIIPNTNYNLLIARTYFVKLLAILPEFINRLMLREGCTFMQYLVTNVKGKLNKKLVFGGKTVHSMAAWTNCPGNVGVITVPFTYAGKMRVACLMDTKLDQKVSVKGYKTLLESTLDSSIERWA